MSESKARETRPLLAIFIGMLEELIHMAIVPVFGLACCLVLERLFR